jgi:hypothetical protein
MKKLIILLISLVFFYSCSREAIQPVEIKVVIIENSKTETTIPIKVKSIPLYEEDIIYYGKLPFRSYIFTKRYSNIRKNPWKSSPKIGMAKPYEKFELLKMVKNGGYIKDNKVWYRIKYGNKVGYIHSSIAYKRELRIREMATRVRHLDYFMNNAKDNNYSIERIIAYKPGSQEKEGLEKDIYGNRGEQSIRADFTNFYGKEFFRYLQDGRIVAVLEKNKGEKKILVKIPDSVSTYRIDKNKIKKIDVSDGINKVIVIDIKNQMEGVFQKEDKVWKLISYTVITSGINNNKHSYETPKGYFLVANTVRQVIFPYEEKVKKDNLGGKVEEDLTETGLKEYNEDDYKIVKKYSRANYGIRFSGGGYLHGIPLKDDTVKKLGGNKSVKARKERNERTLGTFKRSHKCVRTPEEYQSFLYHDFVGYRDEYKNKWWRIPKENVAVIVF